MVSKEKHARQSGLNANIYSLLPGYPRTILLIVVVCLYSLCSQAGVPLQSFMPNVSDLQACSSIAKVLEDINNSFDTAITTESVKDSFGSISGPLITSNFPDPAIIAVDGVSYTFATSNRGRGSDVVHIQVAISRDNLTWVTLKHDPLPKIGAWETGARVWAPDVIQLDNSTFVMYYSDEPKFSPTHHCVGAAISSHIIGPYTPLDTPLSCPDVHTLGGAIDPDGFQDPSTGRRYVTYKIDGNSLGHGGACINTVPPIVPTPIMLQEVSTNDGVTRVGNAVKILDRDNLDGPLIEAPSLHRSHEGVYFLFFSSNCFTTPMYNINYATATDIRGPYVKASRPLLATGDVPGLVAPGGMDIIKDGNTIVFHGHIKLNTDPGFSEQERQNSARGEIQETFVLLSVRGMYSATVTFNGTIASLAMAH